MYEEFFAFPDFLHFFVQSPALIETITAHNLPLKKALKKKETIFGKQIDNNSLLNETNNSPSDIFLYTHQLKA